MKTNEAENLQAALTDRGLQLKDLSVDVYMKTIKLVKKINEFLEERATDINDLIKEYNKEFIEKTKTTAYTEAKKKEETQRTPEEVELLSINPVVTAVGNRLSGPPDFIEKVEAINARELKLKKDELNYIGNGKVFKTVVENASVAAQAVLYEYLFKQ